MCCSSAHYDHLGIGPHNGSGDRIYNGANDDGSGTVSVIEIASALATLRSRPKRSLVFVTFYGEEHGLVGSRYYVEHPLVPLAKTVADINLEQVGRTDDSDGPRVSAATVTGYDYSDVGDRLRRAGRAVGVDVVKHPTKSDSYFGASDNAAFARWESRRIPSASPTCSPITMAPMMSGRRSISPTWRRSIAWPRWGWS